MKKLLCLLLLSSLSASATMLYWDSRPWSFDGSHGGSGQAKDGWEFDGRTYEVATLYVVFSGSSSGQAVPPAVALEYYTEYFDLDYIATSTDLDNLLNGYAAANGVSRQAAEAAASFYVVLSNGTPGTASYSEVWNGSTSPVPEDTVWSYSRLLDAGFIREAADPYNRTYWHAVAVPEPASGALALAGVALLFRRRRASKGVC